MVTRDSLYRAFGLKDEASEIEAETQRAAADRIMPYYTRSHHLEATELRLQRKSGGKETRIGRPRRTVEGVPLAQEQIREVFEVGVRKWRGIGEIPASGYRLREKYAVA